jgi:hypothetical protein
MRLILLALCAITVTCQAAPAQTADRQEDVAKEAAADLRGNRFYNKPGATRAQFNADWQKCRLIARGASPPSGTVRYDFSADASAQPQWGVGDRFIAMVFVGISEGERRRLNRGTCLLVKGWRRIELPVAQGKRIAAMNDAERSAYFDSIVGAEQVEGAVTERTSFAPAPDPALAFDTPAGAPRTIVLDGAAGAAAPIQLAAGEGAVVLSFRRPVTASNGRAARIDFARYDLISRDLIYPPRNWKKADGGTTYAARVQSADPKAPYEVHVLRLSPGDYVLTSYEIGPGMAFGDFCLGAPTFHVGEGETVYLGDFVPLWATRLSTGKRIMALAWAPRLEETRAALTVAQPALATALKPAALHDRATYGCTPMVGVDRWDLVDVEDLPEVGPAP